MVHWVHWGSLGSFGGYLCVIGIIRCRCSFEERLVDVGFTRRRSVQSGCCSVHSRGA